MRRLVDHFALFNQMSAINRFSRDKMAKQENVLEHTGFVVLFCLFMAKAIEFRNGVTFDMGKLLTKAAIHDVDESVLGDIPRPTKYMSETTATEFKFAEERAVENIGSFFGIIDILKDWTHAKDASLEGRLVHLADLAAVAYALWSEVALYGNMSFMRVGREMREALNKLLGDRMLPKWELDIVGELLNIVDACSVNRGHPYLEPILKLDTMLKENDGDKESDEQNEEPIPF